MFATRAAVTSGGGGGGGGHRHQQDNRQCSVPAALLARSGAARFNRRTENVDTMFDTMEELVGNTPSEKNWKAIVIALLVIASILSLITVSVVIVEPKLFARPEQSVGEPLTFTEAMTWLRYLKQLNYQWISCHDNDILVYRNGTSGDLMKLSFSQVNESFNTGVFLQKDRFSEGRIDQFVISPDCRTILVPTKVEKRYRHSSLIQYKILRLSTLPDAEINEGILCPERGCSSDAVKLQLAVWGPTGSFVAFVYDNNIYYADDPFHMEPVRITDSGGNPAVINGIANWVYEEEILETSTALWVSPANKYIAYLRFNDSLTGHYDMPWYGSPENMYLQYKTISYPKAGAVGSPITNVSLMVYDVKRATTVALERPTGVPFEHYISGVRWLDTNRILLAFMDRAQTQGYLTVCSMPGGVCQLIYHESRQAGWVELMKQTLTEPIADIDGKSVFTLLHNSGYRRIAQLRIQTGSYNEMRWITPARYDVSDILYFDSIQRHIYFLSCRHLEDDSFDATRMHVHRISVAGTEHPSVANCLTCWAHPPREEATCEFNKAAFSHSGKYFIHECLGPEPFQYFLRLTDYTAGYPIMQSLEQNEHFRSLLKSRKMPRPIFKQLLLRNETTEKSRADPLVVNAKLLLPGQLNETHVTQYPLLLKVYGGPTSQMVTRRFEFGWQHYMASALHFITASVDGRGTGNRGSDYLFAIKNNFARVELEDQMDALKQLRELQYVNQSALAVFGWSYGGFLALHMLGHPFNVNNTYFSCAVAVASVTDFSYYNSGYTERYLGVKSDASSEAYRRTNVSQLAANYWNKNLFLAHGTGDDNVHYQNQAQLVKALVQENIDFDFMTYPDDSHNLANSQLHVFQRITTFLIDTFNQTSERRRLLKGRTHKFCYPSAGGGHC